METTAQFNRITSFIFDIDGVLTDGTILVLENGLQARQMNIKDGFALQLAVKMGYRILVISGSAPNPVIDRLAKLGINDVRMSVLNKRDVVQSYMDIYHLAKEEVLYMGDDLPDLEAMCTVGLAACPADAVPEIQTICHYVSPLGGGKGCVRDVIERVLTSNGHWNFHPEIASR